MGLVLLNVFHSRWEICLSMREQNESRNCVEYTQRVFTKRHNRVNIAKCLYKVMRESNRNLGIPPPGIPGEFACLVFEEGGNLTFFLVEGGEFAYGVGNLNFSFKHMC